MSKTCANCDHYCACSKWYGFDDETGEAVRRNGGCWSGWHNVKEDPPKVGMKIVAENSSIVFSGEVIEDNGLTINAGFVRMKLLNFEKWHDLPEDEVNDDISSIDVMRESGDK